MREKVRKCFCFTDHRSVSPGVLKTKTPKTPKTPKTLRPPKTPKLENKDPPYFSELRNYDQPVANATES